MHKLFFLAAFVLFFALPACKDAQNDVLTELELNLADCKTNSKNDWTICLLNIEDAICPCNVECVWEGMVEATFKITSPSLDTTFTLNKVASNNHPMEVDSILLQGQVLRMKSCAPTDFCADQGAYAKYVTLVELE